MPAWTFSKPIETDDGTTARRRCWPPTRPWPRALGDGRRDTGAARDVPAEVRHRPRRARGPDRGRGRTRSTWPRRPRSTTSSGYGRAGRGRPVDGRTADGFTPLQLAAYFGAPGAAADLIAAGADVDAVADNPMRIQPLHAAAAGRHSAVALDADRGRSRRQRGAAARMDASAHGRPQRRRGCSSTRCSRPAPTRPRRTMTAVRRPRSAAPKVASRTCFAAQKWITASVDDSDSDGCVVQKRKSSWPKTIALCVTPKDCSRFSMPSSR